MKTYDPSKTFGGLPLSEEQDAAIRHYFKQHRQKRQRIDGAELAAMLRDMLDPPAIEADELPDSTSLLIDAADRAAASIDEAMDPIEASEERMAAMESLSMKDGTH